jgi:hypothetical protein
MGAVGVGPILVIALVSLVFAIFVVADMARRPGWQWAQARSNKAMWLTLEIVCLLLFGIVSILVGILYLAMVRPRLVAAERGPGGPWQGGGWPSAGGWPGQPGYPGGPPPAGPSWPAQPGPPYPPPVPEPEQKPAEEGGGPPRYPGEGPPPYPGAAPAPAPVPRYAPQPSPYVPGPPVSEAPPFGWYPDPSGRHEQRYWDGTRWTEHVSDAGQQSTDPPTPG